MHKSELRARALEARAKAHADDPAPVAATRHLLGVLQQAGCVAGYSPMRGEIDPIPAMVALHAKGVDLCLPVVIAADQPLAFRRWQPGTAMRRGKFGALIPDTKEELIPDTFIVPLVAFDGQGERLGYGGGFYDRTLAQARQARDCTAIGFAYAAQKFDCLPQEPTDQMLDQIVTETGPQIMSDR